MANWAKLQEQLTGLPVVKRARHGIHFDKGNGEIVANFSGKPCHYEDKGVWKPIDTTLLLGADGFYGCPHSPVKMHKDGRVKVDKSDYSQFTDLPGSPIGKVDGNRIVREFPGGRQYLYVTEDGFREEIVVDKPTFPLEKFIGKTSGTLPSAYKTSPQTAVDANGDVFEITSDTKAFGDWLNKAAYPVTIDPDFTSVGGGDCLLRTGANSTKNYGNTSVALAYLANEKWLFRFILSSIDSSYTATAASLVVTKASAKDSTRTTTYNLYEIASSNGDWIEGTKDAATAGSGEPCWDAKAADGLGGVTTAWAGSAGMSTAGTDYVNTSFASASMLRHDEQNTQYTYTLNASGLAAITSWFGDATNPGLVLFSTSAGYVGLYLSEIATESYRPTLSVTYTAGSTGVLRRTNMNAQMSNLTGGMHG